MPSECSAKKPPSGDGPVDADFGFQEAHIKEAVLVGLLSL
jgi:hypothetical protein